MWISLEVMHSIVCPSCNMRNPLPGLRRHLHCRYCQADIPVKEAFKDWAGGMRHLFGGEYDALAEAVVLLDEGHAGTGIERQEYRCAFYRWKPRCPACEKQYAETQYENPVAAITCNDCGHTVPVRIPDENTAKWDPRLHLIINDAGETGDPRLRDKPAASEPIVLSCATCGAGLPIVGDEKQVQCEHCGNINLLPDEVSRQSPAALKDHVFYLVYRIDSARAVQLLTVFFGPNKSRYAAKKKRLEAAVTRALADLLQPENLPLLDALFAGKIDSNLRLLICRDPRLTVAHLEAISRHDPTAVLEIADRKNASDEMIDFLSRLENQAVRLKLAARDQLTEEIVRRFATDASVEVRRKIAARNDLPLELQTTLADDSAIIVRATLAAGKQIAPEALARLANDGEIAVRASVAANPLAATPLINKLARDKDQKVAAFAKKNVNYRPGFFDVLFRRNG